jgi:hypothetical protein
MNSKLIWLLAFLAVGGLGYYLWNQIPDTPKSQTLGGYSQTLHDSEMRAKVAASSANSVEVQQAVNKYKTDKGSLPASLQDLVPDYLDHVPGGFQYDAATGTVSAAQ